jgi:exonuclease III
MDTLKILSVNTRGLNSKEKRDKFYKWISDIRIDVIFIQETHYVEKNIFQYDCSWKGKSIHCFSDSTFSKGVSILFRKELNVHIMNIHKTNDGRKLLINLNIEDTAYTLINIYAPNIESCRLDFFKGLKRFILNNSNNLSDIILGGDFNCHIESERDKSSKYLQEFLRQIGLKDIWREKHDKHDGFTWCDANNVPKSRIDFIFTNTQKLINTKQISTRKIPGTHNNGTRMTDHRALKLDISLHDKERGRGYWKLNTSLLNCNSYKTQINNLIKEISSSEGSSVDKWERLKLSIKNLSISFSINRQKTYKQLILKIEKDIARIENLPYTLIDMNKKRELENRLSNIYDEKARGAQIRSRAKWVSDGEKNTKYFLGLEKKHQTQNIINEILQENNILTESDDILGAMCDFYENLYSSNSTSNEKIDEYLNDIDVNKLSDTDKDMCDFFPSLPECKETVMRMKSNVSPGLDGLPNEFYKCFWDQLSSLFYNMMKEIFLNGKMTHSQRLAVISLIHKKGERNDLKNYRPISLTNTDYKIIAFIFALRLQKIIHKQIGTEQTAYVKGRFIGINARFILDIFEYCENNNENGILLFLDFEKAFDSVEWNFLFKTLEKFNFGPNFLKWIKILYHNPIFRLKNNGWITKTCKMQRGIRQGCPISALLYLYIAEILSLKIKNNNMIEGFQAKNMNKEVKNIQHADDMTLALKNIESLNQALNTINNFCIHAGSKINISKTECILLGPLKDMFSEIKGITVSNRAVRCLGIYIGHD